MKCKYLQIRVVDAYERTYEPEIATTKKLVQLLIALYGEAKNRLDGLPQIKASLGKCRHSFIRHDATQLQ